MVPALPGHVRSAQGHGDKRLMLWGNLLKPLKSVSMLMELAFSTFKHFLILNVISI